MVWACFGFSSDIWNMDVFNQKGSNSNSRAENLIKHSETEGWFSSLCTVHDVRLCVFDPVPVKVIWFEQTDDSAGKNCPISVCCITQQGGDDVRCLVICGFYHYKWNL